VLVNTFKTILLAFGYVLLGLGVIAGLFCVIGFLATGVDNEWREVPTNWTGVFLGIVLMLPGITTLLAYQMLEDQKKKARRR